MSWYRLHFGVDFGDEAYHVGIPLRFIRGDKPFIDEIFLSHAFALLTKPIVYLYYKWSGGTESLVLFLRYTLLCLKVITGIIIFYSLKTKIGIIESIIIFSIWIVSFNGSFSIAYSTLPQIFLPTAFILYATSNEKLNALTVCFIGILLSLSTISLPNSVPIFFILVVTMEAIITKTSFRFFNLFLLIISSISFTAFIAFYYKITPTMVWEVFLNSKYNAVGASSFFSIGKVYNLMFSFLKGGPFKIEFIIWGVLLFFLNRFNKKFLVNILFLILPLLSFYKARGSCGGLGAVSFCLYYSIIGIFLICNKFNLKLFLYVWLPLLFASLPSFFVSNSAFYSLLQIFSPAILISIIYIFRFYKTHDYSSNIYKFSVYTSTAMVVLIMGYFQFRGIYMEKTPIEFLNSKVEKGPYKGLYTNRVKKEFIEELQNQIRKYENKNKRIIVFCFFPAAYLLTEMKPASASIYGCDISWKKCLDLQLKYFNELGLAIEIFEHTYRDLDAHRADCYMNSAIIKKFLPSSIKLKYYNIYFDNKSLNRIRMK